MSKVILRTDLPLPAEDVDPVHLLSSILAVKMDADGEHLGAPDYGTLLVLEDRILSFRLTEHNPAKQNGTHVRELIRATRAAAREHKATASAVILPTVAFETCEDHQPETYNPYEAVLVSIEEGCSGLIVGVEFLVERDEDLNYQTVTPSKLLDRDHAEELFRSDYSIFRAAPKTRKRRRQAAVASPGTTIH